MQRWILVILIVAAVLLAAGVYRISSTRKNREILSLVEPKTESTPSAQLPTPIPIPSAIPMDASKTPNPSPVVDLITAVRSGTIGDVARALSRTKEVNATDEQGATALHYAAHRGDMPTVRGLIAHGADVNSGNDKGATPLHVAALKGFEPVARLLLESRADVMAEDEDGWTPLHMNLPGRGRDYVARVLLENGADP
jgi:hypothetical protein